MTEKLRDALEAVVGRLLSAVETDAALRAEVRALAEAVLSALGREDVSPTEARSEPPQVQAAPTVAEPLPPPPAPPPPPPPSLPPPPPRHEALPDTTGIEVPIGWARKEGVADAELVLIEKRCRAKADGARWAAERQRRLAAGADFRTEIEPKDREVIERAKRLEDCFLWMNHPSGPCPEDWSLMDDVAGCFEATADGIALVLAVLDEENGDGELLGPGLDLLAEAQSALRQAILRVDGPKDDEQWKVYCWLRGIAHQRQIFIRRHMRLDDPADPTAWAGILERISELDARLQQSHHQEKQRKSWLNCLRYHVNRIRSGGTDHDWKRICETLDEMVAGGVQPSNPEARELLLPVIDDMPDDVQTPPNVALVLRELDRYLATRTPTVREVYQEPTAEVKRAARLLHGKTVVLIGGDQRPFAREALRDALELRELVWVDTRAHESLDAFEPYVARPDVAVVLLAIRWSSHSFGEVQQFCNRYDKPLVRLPGGYNPNQVAFQVLQQCGERLAKK
jgi:hypothetical protein